MNDDRIYIHAIDKETGKPAGDPKDVTEFVLEATGMTLEEWNKLLEESTK